MTYRLELPPIDFTSLDDLKVRLEDWRRRLEDGVSQAFASYGTMVHARLDATAVGATSTGYLSVASTTLGVPVPAGYEMAILSASASIRTGAFAGAHKISLVVQEIAIGGIPAFERILATQAGIAISTEAYFAEQGSWDSPLMVVDAGKVVCVGWKNDSTSPGALAATTHFIQVSYVLRPTS